MTCLSNATTGLGLNVNPGEPLLSVNLSVDYAGKPGVLRNAALDVHRGEVLGLVGQSGSGKSTLGLAILRLLDPAAAQVKGRIDFQGQDLLGVSEREMQRVRGREIGLVLQSPLASLNPSLRIGSQLMEAWRAHSDGPFEKAQEYLLDLLSAVSLPAEEGFLRRYPRQLSVGLAQRVLIAMALVHGPSLILADEPTSALDMITQSEILELLARINRERKTAILYISHDLLSVATLCHRVAILHERRIVECGAVEQIFRAPQHPYTRKLIEAIPRNPF